MRRLVVLVLPLLFAAHLGAATRTWTGSAGNNWTTPANWSGGIAPVGGDDLVFPTSGANQATTNNDFLAGASFNSIDFSGGTYRLNGNTITLGAGGINTTGGGFHQIAVPVTLGAAQTWVLNRGTSGVSLSSAASLNLNGMALAIANNGNFAPGISGVISGSGSISLNGPAAGLNLGAANTTTAPFTITNNVVFIHGTYLGPMILGDSGRVSIDPEKTVGTVTATGRFAGFEPGFGFPSGVANSGNVILIPTTEFLVFFRTASDFNSLNLTGTLDLGGADLEISGNTVIPAGTTFTIVNNDGSDPVTGTFRGLLEGAEVVAPFGTAQLFRISYVGGTGNDVVLTALGPATGTTLTLTSSANPSSAGQPVTFTARVTATSSTATPTGSVVFGDFDPTGTFTLLATVPLDATGSATFTTSSLTGGSHEIVADYINNPPFAPSFNNLTQEVVVSPRRRAVRR